VAQIVLIDTGNLNILINETYDVVAVHEDDVDLSTSGYTGYRVVKITGITADQIKEILSAKVPEVRTAYKQIASPSKWTFLELEESDIEERKEVWLNTDAKWYFLEDRPKYSVKIPFSVANIEDLENIIIPANVKIQAVNQVATEKIHLKSVNLVEAKDLV